MALTLEQHITIKHLSKERSLSWKRLLRRGFSTSELEGAQVGIVRRPLQDMLVGFESLREGDLMQVEVYRGKHGISARLYFQPQETFVPTYVIATREGLEELQRTESKLLKDPVMDGDTIRGEYGTVNLRSLPKTKRLRKLFGELLAQESLVYAERMTTHVYTGQDRHIWFGWRRATIRMFADRVTPDSNKHTTLVFRANGKPLREGVGALNVTNDTNVIGHRRKMTWIPVG